VGSGARQCLRPPLVVPPGHSVQGLEEAGDLCARLLGLGVQIRYIDKPQWRRDVGPLGRWPGEATGGTGPGPGRAGRRADGAMAVS